MNTRLTVNARFEVMVRYVGSLGVAVLLLPGMGACGGEVMVGDVESEVEGTGSPDECVSEDAMMREARARWLATVNDFGELGGSRWEGTIRGLPTLVLELGTDQTGTLVVGTPPPPPTNANEGYLELAEPYPLGATFPLHGASFDGSELIVPVPAAAPFDAWCALQPSVHLLTSEPCWFSTSVGADCSSDVSCDLYDGRTVDDTWVTNADQCTCTSTDCFASLYWPTWEVGETWKDLENYYDMPALRLNYDPETDTLKGGHFAAGSPPPAGSDGIQAKFVRAP